MERLQAIKDKLQQHATTHPTLVTLWTSYIDEMHRACLETCEQAEALMQDLPKVCDPSSLSQLVALYTLTHQ